MKKSGLFGIKLKVSDIENPPADEELYDAIITRNPSDKYPSPAWKAPYRLTWFYKDYDTGAIEVMEHIPLFKNEIVSLLKTKKWPDSVDRRIGHYLVNGLPHIISIGKQTGELTELHRIIKENLYGQKLKILIHGNLFPALISRNTRTAGGEGDYRLTWFDPKTREPRGHLDFNSMDRDRIMSSQSLPMGLKIKCFKNGIPIPQLIFEGIQPMKTAPYILVGTVTDDGEVVAKYGGSHAIHGMRSEYNWRYNPYSEMVYWHNPHPKAYEEWVKIYIEKKGHTVSWQVTLKNIDDKETYDNLWRDAHGID